MAIKSISFIGGLVNMISKQPHLLFRLFCFFFVNHNRLGMAAIFSLAKSLAVAKQFSETLFNGVRSPVVSWDRCTFIDAARQFFNVSMAH